MTDNKHIPKPGETLFVIDGYGRQEYTITTIEHHMNNVMVCAENGWSEVCINLSDVVHKQLGWYEVYND